MLPRSVLERRLVAAGCIQNNWTDLEIHREYGFSRSFCLKLRKLISRDCSSILFSAGRLGAPFKVTADIKQRVNQLTLVDRRMTNAMIARIISTEIRQISAETVRRIREELGFRYLPPVRTFFLTDVQRLRRVAFAEEELRNWRDWTRVVFTDESYFWLGDDHRYLWRKRGETGSDIELRTKKFGEKVLIFAGFALGYKSELIIVTRGTVDADAYVDKLIQGSHIIPDMNNLHGENAWTLMQDGASAHTAKSTMSWLQERCEVLTNWPSGSPDLNPIENLWSIMKARVSELGADNVDTLKQIIRDVWYSISDVEIANLVMSMRDRLEKVIQKQGGPNGY